MSDMNTLSTRNSERGSPFTAAFTLIELLVVIGIIVILAGFLLPVMTKAKGKTMETNIMNNIRQVHLANIQYKQAYDEMFLINTLEGTTVGVDFEPLREHGYTEGLMEDFFRLTTLTEDKKLESIMSSNGVSLDFNSFHPSGRGLLYFNFHTTNPSSALISRDMINDEFGYNIPEDTIYMIFGVGMNGIYDTDRPRGDFVYLARESNANIERWPE